MVNACLATEIEMKKLLIIVAALIGLTMVANADIQITMRPGSQCWSYEGLDTRFFGSFSGGQALTIAVMEEQSNEKGGTEVVAYDAKNIWVNGPDHYYRSGNSEDNDRVIYTEKPGRYIFNLYEHGTGTGAPVFVKLCAMKNEQRKPGPAQ